MRLTWILAVVFAAAATAQTPEAKLGAALHQERVTGNMQAAIDGYRKVLATKGVSRAVAAQAQYHIGICFEKLGDMEARKAFENVVRNFSDQRTFVSQAQARLAALGASTTDTGAARTRLVWDEAADLGGAASADGRYFSFVDWSTCDLGLKDLTSGEIRKLTDYGGCVKAKGEVEVSAVSPDGKRVAYSYRRFAGSEPDRATIAVVGTDGKGRRDLISESGLRYSEPRSWSPDGKWIAATVLFRDSRGEEIAVVVVGADSGEVRRFAVKDKQWVFNVTFSPNGKWLAYTAGGTGGNPHLLITRPVEDVNVAETVVAKDAMMMGWTPDGNLLFTRQRETNQQLFHLPMMGGKASGEATPLYTSADIGAGFGGMTAKGSLLYKTYNRQAETFILPWTPDGKLDGKPIAALAATTGVGWLLGPGIAHFSNDGKRVFSQTARNGLLIRELSTATERIVHPELKTWHVARWKHDDSALLVLGVDKGGKTGIYEVAIESGKAILVAEVPDGNWSFTTSRDGSTVFYGKPMETRARDLTTGQDKAIFGPTPAGNYDLRVSHDGTRLAIRSTEALNIVELKSGQSREVYRIQEGKHAGSAIWGMEWSADDGEIVAIVRMDVGLDQFECWTLPVAGGEPRRQPIDKGWRGISFSPDGKFVVSTKITKRLQLWALENFLPSKK